MSSKPKILIIYRNFYPLTGGIETALVEIFSRLAAKGWGVSAITRKTSGLLPSEDIFGISVKRYGNLIYSTPLVLLFLNLRKYDLVYFNNFEILPGIFIYPYIYILKLLGRKHFKVIYSSQGLLNIDKESYVGFKMKLKRIIDNTIGVFLINSTIDRIFAVSEHEKDRIMEVGVKPDMIEVIHNGVNDEAFTYSDSEVTQNCKDEVFGWGKYIVQLGRIDRVKNYDAVIRVLPYVQPEANFIIVGPDQDSEYKKELLKLAESLGVSERVKFIGAKYGAEKFYILKKSKVLIHLSKAEGFCLSVLEGMSQGRPCVVSTHPSLKEMIKDGVNGFAYNYNDSNSIADSINKLLDSADETISSNNIAYASKYTWTHISEQTAKAMMKLNENTHIV